MPTPSPIFALVDNYGRCFALEETTETVAGSVVNEPDSGVVVDLR